MENNNYVSVGNIIEQERLKRQAQIAKGVSSDVYDHIEKAHQDDLSKGVEMTDNLSRFANDVDNLNKAETEFLLSKLQRQIIIDPDSNLLKSFKSIAINHLNDLEKAYQNEEMSLEKAKYQVGQPHPNNPNILWTEWQPGKFDWKSKNGRYWKGKTGGSAKNQTPAPRKPGSTDEIERITAAGVRSSILGLNNIATNVKDNGDHFKIDFDANDFNTNGKRSPQIDRIAKFLESMGASCVIGSNSIKAYKKHQETNGKKDFDFKFIEAERGISDIYPKPDYVKEGYIRKIPRTESKSGATEYVGVLKFNDGLKIEERLFSRTEAKKWFIDELKKKQQSITNKI